MCFLGSCLPVTGDAHLGTDVELDLIETVTGTRPDGGDPVVGCCRREQRDVAGRK